MLVRTLPLWRRVLNRVHNSQVIELSDGRGSRVECRAMRLTFVGELGWELHCAAQDAPRLYRMLHDASQRHQLGLRNAGYRAIDSLSIEKGAVIFALHSGKRVSARLLVTSSSYSIAHLLAGILDN